MKKLSVMLVTGLMFSMFFVGGANAVPVQYTGVYGGDIYISGTWHTGTVSAGIYRLKVDGIATDSFCIDLAENSYTGSAEYTIVPLTSAADSPFGPMTAQAAIDVRKLWAMAYSPAMTQAQALSLQVAIWEVTADQAIGYNLGSGSFIASNAGAAAYLGALGNATAQANLSGLTNRTYQDFVIQGVPEPATMLLLGFGLVGLAGIRRAFKK